MARTKEFERDTVLDDAIALFCDHGYEGTSTEQLLGKMRINRQSLYDTFGDKRQLYLEALQRYVDGNVASQFCHRRGTDHRRRLSELNGRTHR